MVRKHPHSLFNSSMSKLVEYSFSTCNYILMNSAENLPLDSEVGLPEAIHRKRKKNKSFDDNQLPKKKLKYRRVAKKSSVSENNIHEVETDSQTMYQNLSPDFQIGAASQVELFDRFKKYLLVLPETLWVKFANVMLNYIDDNKVCDNLTHMNLHSRLIDILFCAKLLSYSSKSCEDDISSRTYQRLKFCCNLKKLQINHSLNAENQNLVLNSLLYLNKLCIISLIAEHKYSYHWAISKIAENCNRLTELLIVYNNTELNETNNIKCLIKCTKLKKLILYSFGIRSEYLDIIPLLSLPNLKCIFHKELPNALIDLYNCKSQNHNTEKFKLESLILCDWNISTGSQYIYIPDSYLENIIKLCPHLHYLSLVRPSSLINITKHLRIHQLSLCQTTVVKSIGEALYLQQLRNLNVLKLSNAEKVTSNEISLIAEFCPLLEVLELISCHIISTESNHDKNERLQYQFGSLQKLVLLDAPLPPRPFCCLATDTWKLDTNIFQSILDSTKNLKTIYITVNQESYNDHHETNDEIHVLGSTITQIYKSSSQIKQLLLSALPIGPPTEIIDAIFSKFLDLDLLRGYKWWNLSDVERKYILTHYENNIQ